MERTMYTVGTRIYNHGDMANPDHFGTITRVKDSNYEITPDADSSRTETYWVGSYAFSAEYRGNGLTRMVTEAAYDAWRAEQIANLMSRMAS